MLRSHVAAGSPTITYSETSLTIPRNKNWASRALQALPDFLHVVSSDGRIRYASDSCKAVVGYESAALVGQDVHSFVHPDDLDVFTREFQEAFIYGHPARFIYRFWSQAKKWVAIESQCNLYRGERTNSTADCHELIFMARPYVNEIGAFFDSFLEQKLAHEVLKRQISQLQDSEDDDEDNMHYDESLQLCDSVCVETDYTFHHQVKTQAQMEGSSTVLERRSAGKSAVSTRRKTQGDLITDHVSVPP
jgi:PAS domain S-box-containing protein